MGKLTLPIEGADTPESWRCPYCNHYATIQNKDRFFTEGRIPNYDNGHVSYVFKTITCPNAKCGELFASIVIEDTSPSTVPTVMVSNPHPNYLSGMRNQKRRIDVKKQLLPPRNAKIFPDFVPLAIRIDYEESCAIKDLSPKASATLSRRCLQGIIRDFYDIKNKSTLFEEINELEKREGVDPELVKAFSDLREIGNIGAHMGKEVGLIIDIDPDEAGILLNFIENVIHLTYIQRHNRDSIYKNLSGIAKNKKTIPKN